MRAEKLQLGKDIASYLVDASFIYFVSYKGIKTSELDKFRSKLIEAGANCHVLKNRVVRKIAELNGLTALAETKLAGDTAVIAGADPAAAAKIVKEFASSTNGIIAPKTGYFEGAMLTAEDIKAIAEMPSKDQLRAQLLGLLVAVPTGLVRVLNAKAASIVNVINAYKNKLEEAN